MRIICEKKPKNEWMCGGICNKEDCPFYFIKFNVWGGGNASCTIEDSVEAGDRVQFKVIKSPENIVKHIATVKRNKEIAEKRKQIRIKKLEQKLKEAKSESD